MDYQDTVKRKCPSCARTLDGVSSPNESRAKTGDLTVCFYCETVLVFTEAGLRHATARDRKDCPELEETLAQLRRFKNQRALRS